MWKQHHWKHFNSRQSICACLWNSWFCSSCTDQFPCRQPQAHNEFIHWIQQPVTASSWQHSPSTSATSLGEISPGWQKSASDGMLGTYLFSFSAVIRIKSSCALPASLSKQDVPLPGESDTRGAGFPCYWLNKIPSLSFFCLITALKYCMHWNIYLILFTVKEIIHWVVKELIRKKITQCVLKVRGIISHLKNTT